MRISKDEYYLKIAETIAIRSTCLKHKYGALIVSDDVVVATGYNGSPRGEINCCDTGECYCEKHITPVDKKAAEHGGQYGLCVAVHAEQNAIISASRKELSGATLYLACLSAKVNTGPCNICDRMIKNAGIARVVTKEGIICKPL
jgi:dCMP deaminase